MPDSPQAWVLPRTAQSRGREPYWQVELTSRRWPTPGPDDSVVGGCSAWKAGGGMPRQLNVIRPHPGRLPTPSGFQPHQPGTLHATLDSPDEMCWVLNNIAFSLGFMRHPRRESWWVSYINKEFKREVSDQSVPHEFFRWAHAIYAPNPRDEAAGACVAPSMAAGAGAAAPIIFFSTHFSRN